MELPKRKPNRIPNFNYSAAGAYFITICTQEKKNILSRIVGGGDLDAPQISLSPIGQIVEQYILSSEQISGLHIDKYVVMPNHIHLIVFLDSDNMEPPVTPANHKLPHFVATLKRFCHRDAGIKFFQRSYHDHVIRGEKDYQMIWQYIDNNPASWEQDCFYFE